MERKIRFVIIGSGWRSLYYVRVARALQGRFELAAMYCRTEEKARRMAAEHQIRTTTSIAECMNCGADFAVIAVNKASIAEVGLEWLERGIPVLCETPAALDIAALNRLWEAHERGGRLAVAEQYTTYPAYSALLGVINRGLIGTPDCLNISLAHEYHGASLMRAMLGIAADTAFAVSAKTYAFPTAETLTRYDSYDDGRLADKKRTVAAFEFADGKVALYDFDSEQYRSPIRKNTIKLQGSRGEIIDDTVYYLDRENQPAVSKLQITARTVERAYDNPNLCRIAEVTDAGFEGACLYRPPFGLCGLSQDETAVAVLMRRMAAYVRGSGGEPYPLREALQDAYMAILMREADESGRTVRSERQVWHEATEKKEERL